MHDDVRHVHDDHPLAHPRPGAMTQLLASRIAAEAAQAPPPVLESSLALASARRTAATIASNVPRQSTLYVAVPAIPPALAAARSAAAAAVSNNDSSAACIATSAAAGAAAAGTALEALRQQSEKRTGSLFAFTQTCMNHCSSGHVSRFQDTYGRSTCS